MAWKKQEKEQEKEMWATRRCSWFEPLSMAGDTWGKAASHAEKKGYIDRWDLNRLNLLRERETPNQRHEHEVPMQQGRHTMCVPGVAASPLGILGGGARRWLSEERLEELKAEHHRDTWKQRWSLWEEREEQDKKKEDEKKEDEQKGSKKADDSQTQMLEEILGDLDAELRTKTKKEEKQLDEERRAQEEKKRKSEEKKRKSEELLAQPAKNRRQVEEAQKNEKKKVEEEERRKKMEEAKQAELEKRRLEKEAKARRAQEKFKERSDQQKKEKEVKKERKEKSKEVKEEFAQSWEALPDDQISLMAVKIKDSAGKMYYLQRDEIQIEAEEEMANLERKLTERCAHAFSFAQRDQQPKMKICKKWRQIIESQVFRICSELFRTVQNCCSELVRIVQKLFRIRPICSELFLKMSEQF